jgi:hypothetical protein
MILIENVTASPIGRLAGVSVRFSTFTAGGV